MYKQARNFKRGLFIEIPPREKLIPFTLEQEHLFEHDSYFKKIEKIFYFIFGTLFFLFILVFVLSYLLIRLLI